MAEKDSLQRLVDKVLGDPSLYSEEFKSWLPRHLEGHPLLRLVDYQLPPVEGVRYIGEGDNPDFLNSWANYNLGYEQAGFYRDPFGRVYLTGMVKDGTHSTTIFTLPGGYRPKLRELFAARGLQGGVYSPGRIDVAADGSVIHVDTESTGAIAWISLSGINFRAFS